MNQLDVATDSMWLSAAVYWIKQGHVLKHQLSPAGNSCSFCSAVAVRVRRADSSNNQCIASAVLGDAQLAVDVHVVKPASQQAVKPAHQILRD